VAVLSNGAFAGVPRRIAAAIEAKSRAREGA
jgi:hypothetical protein